MAILEHLIRLQILHLSDHTDKGPRKRCTVHRYPCRSAGLAPSHCPFRPSYKAACFKCLPLGVRFLPRTCKFQVGPPIAPQEGVGVTSAKTPTSLKMSLTSRSKPSCPWSRRPYSLLALKPHNAFKDLLGPASADPGFHLGWMYFLVSAQLFVA